MQITVAAEPADWPLSPARAGETALLVIDMQRDFCDPGGYVATCGYDIAPIRAVVPRLAAVLAAVRGWGALVVHTREGHRADLSDLSRPKAERARLSGAPIGSVGPLGRLLVRGQAGWQIIPELAPAPGEVVIDKTGYSAFHATDLEATLRHRGIRRLVLTGVTTDVCVHSTLRSAVDGGFECLTLADCCAATVPAHHDAAIGTILTEGGIFGAVSDSARLLAALGG